MSLSTGQQSLDGQPMITDDEVRDLLVGAVDTHVHPGPSPFPRLLSIRDAAEQAAAAGFRAIVVKDHFHSMIPDIAAAGLNDLESRITVGAGVALNDHVGGFNPYAVELAVAQGGCIVWLPTISAAKHVARSTPALTFPTATIELRPGSGLTALDEAGDVRSELLEIMEIVRDSDAILAGGHLDAAELDVVFRVGHRMRLTRMVVNHPHFVVEATPEQCAVWATLGVYVEHSLCMFDDRSTFQNAEVELLLRYIDVVGPEQTILCSDLGQRNNPLPVQAFERLARALLDAGINADDVRRMTGGNAADLLQILA